MRGTFFKVVAGPVLLAAAMGAADAQAGGNRPMPPASNDIDINNTARGGTGYGGRGGDGGNATGGTGGTGGNSNLSNDINIRGPVMFNAPSMPWLYVRDKCGDAWTFSLGGAGPIGGGGAGAGKSNNSGIDSPLTLEDVAAMSAKDRKEIVFDNLSSGDRRKLQCGLTALQEVKGAQAHEKEMADLMHKHQTGMAMLNHFLDRRSNKPGEQIGGSVLEHGAAFGYAAQINPELNKSMRITVKAFTEARNEKGKRVLPEDIIIKMFSELPEPKKEPVKDRSSPLTEWGEPSAPAK